MRVNDPRLSSLINWVWASLGAIGIIVGVGIYNKISSMNDTLIIAVAKLESQAQQINDIRGELSRQRDEIGALRSQVSQIEGRTLRGIQEAVRAR